MPVLCSIGWAALGNSGDRPKKKCNSVELFSFYSIVIFYLYVLGRRYSEQYYFLKYFFPSKQNKGEKVEGTKTSDSRI